MAKVTPKDFAQTGPGTLAGRYLRSYWQPVFHAKELHRGHAKPIKIMSQQFTLYRGEDGAPHLVDFHCPHRGAQLSVGWVEGDDIRCFYHGWKYNAAGQCIEQPAEPEPFCHKVRINSYPTREYLDLIFAYLGEGDPPEFPRYPDFEEFEGVREYATYFRACNYFNNLENYLDATHLGFVHRDHAGGFDGRTDSPILHVSETSWGATSRHERPSGKTGQTQFGMPNVTHLKAFVIAPNIPGHRENLSWYVPIDDESHLRFGISLLKMSQESANKYRELQNKERTRESTASHILSEEVIKGNLRREDVDPETTDIVVFVDDVAQIGQGRIADRTKEHLGRGDVGVILIRQLWIRELSALSEGRPLTPWRYDSNLETAQADSVLAQ